MGAQQTQNTLTAWWGSSPLAGANAAYLEENGAKSAANNLGLPNFIWIDLSDQIDNLYGFVAGCSEYAVLSFRGTAKFQDWMTNVNAAPARFSWFFEGAPEPEKSIPALPWPCATRGQN